MRTNNDIKALIAALGDEDDDVRWRAACALGKIKSEYVVDELINKLKDNNPIMRYEAAIVLSTMEPEDKVITALFEFMSDMPRDFIKMPYSSWLLEAAEDEVEINQ
jgi:HEAT repeat protein